MTIPAAQQSKTGGPVFRQELLEEWKQEAQESGACCKYRKMVLITGVMNLQEKNKVLQKKYDKIIKTLEICATGVFSNRKDFAKKALEELDEVK